MSFLPTPRGSLCFPVILEHRSHHGVGCLSAHTHLAPNRNWEVGVCMYVTDLPGWAATPLSSPKGRRIGPPPSTGGQACPHLGSECPSPRRSSSTNGVTVDLCVCTLLTRGRGVGAMLCRRPRPPKACSLLDPPKSSRVCGFSVRRGDCKAGLTGLAEPSWLTRCGLCYVSITLDFFFPSLFLQHVWREGVARSS